MSIKLVISKGQGGLQIYNIFKKKIRGESASMPSISTNTSTGHIFDGC